MVNLFFIDLEEVSQSSNRCVASLSTSHLRTNTSPHTHDPKWVAQKINSPLERLKNILFKISGISCISKISNYPDKKHPSTKNHSFAINTSTTNTIPRHSYQHTINFIYNINFVYINKHPL